MTRTGKAVLLAVVMAGATFAACSSQRISEPTPESQGGTTNVGNTGLPTGQVDTGRVGASLLIGPGLSLTSLNWTITNGANSYSGIAQIGDAQSVEWVAGGILAGTGYSLGVTGADSNGDVCAGGTSSSFAVTKGGVTQVTLVVTCTSSPDSSTAANVTTGSVEVDASVTLVQQPPIQCPGITSLNASPAELAPGQSSQLGVAMTTPSPVQWTVSPATGGSFVNPLDGGTGATLQAPQFLCSTPNTQVTVTATIGLPDSGACAGVAFTSLSALINCEPACAAPTDCPGQDTACLARTCTAGACGLLATPEGTSCDGAGDVCNGAGACVPFTFSVVRIGTGDAGTLTTAAAPVYLEQRLVSDGGIVGAPILLPTTPPGPGQDSFTMPGIALIAGLSRSQDGRYLTAVGYNAAVGTSNPANSADAIVVARVDSSGNVDTSTQLVGGGQAFLSLNSVRSSVTANGSAFWVGGLGGTIDGGTASTGGIWYIPFGVVDGVQLNPVQVRLLGVSGGQLYGSADTNAGEVFTVGVGLPDGGTPAITGLAGLPLTTTGVASPWQFVLLTLTTAGPAPDTLYVAQSQAVGSGPTGIQRWSLGTGGTWTQTASLQLAAPDGGAPVGFRGLTGIKTGPNQATLIATSVEVPTRIAVFTDDGVSSPWSGTSRVVAAANGGQSFFRGVALSPHP